MTPIVELLERAERTLLDRVAGLRKSADRLSRGRKEIAKGVHPLPVLRGLIEEIRKFPRESGGQEWDSLIEGLTHHEAELARRIRKEFPATLREVSQAANLAFRVVGDQFAVGPFIVRAEYAKDTAILEYAKIEVTKDLPLDPNLVVREIQRNQESLLAPLDDPKAFSQQLEEAIRVVVGRQRKSLVADELRADLPLVYREMLYLRQGWTNPTAKRKLTEYPLARFVAEVKMFIQSEENLDSARRFRLEPAVIENTKNLSKAFYFPRDLADGTGEGMYFQAIVFSQTR
jgi:hypothetical protein